MEEKVERERLQLEKDLEREKVEKKVKETISSN